MIYSTTETLNFDDHKSEGFTNYIETKEYSQMNDMTEDIPQYSKEFEFNADQLLQQVMTQDSLCMIYSSPVLFKLYRKLCL